MFAIQCTEFAPPEQLQFNETDDPTPGPGQVLVDVHAAGLGFVDALWVQGLYQVKPPLPFIPGSEVTGVVTALGEGVTTLSVGDEVFGMAQGGAFAEKTLLVAADCAKKPANLTFEAAAGFLVSYCTALFAFDNRGGITGKGETILVLGAGGGVGLAAIDLAKAMGCFVIACASSAEKRGACTAQGADAVVDYTQEDWRKQVEAAAKSSPSGGVDVVYDPVGGDFSNIALRTLKPWGRFLVIGFANGEIPKIPLNLALLKQCQIVGVDLGGWVRTTVPSGQGALLDKLCAMVESGALTPPQGQRYPLADAGKAMRDLLDRKVIGKAVLIP
jgi:NADPH2:quinone reductase